MWRHSLTSRVPTLVFAAAVAGCAGGDRYVYKMYPGQVRPLQEIVAVNLGNSTGAIFDGLPVSHADWTEVHLLPGKHYIEWESEFGVSVMIEPSGFATGAANGTVALQAGHRYVMKSARTTGHGYKLYLWLEDAETRDVIAGEKKP